MQFIVEFEGNEGKFEHCIQAIFEDQCIVNQEQNFQINTKELVQYEFPTSVVVEYFLEKNTFQLDRFIDFFSKIRRLHENGFVFYSHRICEWFEQTIVAQYFDILENEWEFYEEKKVRNQKEFLQEDLDRLKFFCLIAIEHMKYDTFGDAVGNNFYFKRIEQLASQLVNHLRQFGSQQLDLSLTDFQDEDIQCHANDVFATINIVVQNDHEKTYFKALNFINHLLRQDFPRSFAIEFSSPNQQSLDIENLQLCGQNYLFAGAVKFEALHSQMIEYINLSLKEFEWYSNLDEEECAIPSTFAVLALVLNDRKYFPVLEQYLSVVDDGHQSIQQHFTVAFIRKYGIDKTTLALFLKLIRSMQEHPPYPEFIDYFQNKTNLELLLEAKQNYDNYEWSYVLYSIFGHDSDSDRVAEKFSPELWQIYLQIREEREEDELDDE